MPVRASDLSEGMCLFLIRPPAEASVRITGQQDVLTHIDGIECHYTAFDGLCDRSGNASSWSDLDHGPTPRVARRVLDVKGIQRFPGRGHKQQSSVLP